MTKAESGIEVFRDLYLRHPADAKVIRDALLHHLAAPWAHWKEREKEIRDDGEGAADVIALTRGESEGKPGISLWLFQESNGYKVSNIVPQKSGFLGISNYNKVLSDFVDQVVTPAEKASGFSATLTQQFQSINDLIDEEAATALTQFSSLANMSTGRGHPLDEKRWLDFLIAAHRSAKAMDSELLSRWLIEVKHWPPETAYELASEYSLSLSLLTRYDERND